MTTLLEYVRILRAAERAALVASKLKKRAIAERRFIYQSDMHPDPEIAAWLFESLIIDETTDPLYILISNEENEKSNLT